MLNLHRKRVAATVIAVVLVAGAIIAVLLRSGLSPAEKRLLGRWKFRTIDNTKQIELFEFRADRIAVLVDVDPIPTPLTSFYDWQIDDDVLVLTSYDLREFG